LVRDALGGAVRGVRMARKRTGRGLRVGPFRYWQWKDDRKVRRERELAREARRWDEDRIRYFEEVQRGKREWIKIVEIAESFSELGGSGPNAAARAKAFQMIEDDLLAGVFEESGRSQVRFVFPGVSWTGKMTRQWLQDAIDNNYDNEHGRSYLKHCWLPRNVFERWCARHHLPELLLGFQPTEGKYSDKGGQQPTAAGDSPKNAATRQPPRERARRVLQALFGSEVPDAAVLPNKHLAAQVNKWLEERKQPPVGQRTIQRAAGRK
jgi:hypothetical protein